MSTEKNNGGPAFPAPSEIIYSPNEPGYRQIISAGGMTLRDYFAAAALQGILANNAKDYDDADMAEYSYALADYMLATREKKEAQK